MVMTRFPSHAMPAARCPWCGHGLDAATDVSGGGAHPAVGDWSLCICCAGLMRFEARGALRRATAAELAEEVAGLREPLLAAQRKLRGLA